MTVPQKVSDLGENLWRRCFAYPQRSRPRKHGPRGYGNYESYRDWLRDEFLFRCAYCLMRETWLRGKEGFHIDHCIPQSQQSGYVSRYENLVYTCPWCNRVKSDLPLPDPLERAADLCLAVADDGRIHSTTGLGAMVIQILELNRADVVRQRFLVQQVVRLAEEKNDVLVLVQLLGWPQPLPNLKSRRPPKGNARVHGVHDCCFERERRGELGAIY